MPNILLFVKLLTFDNCITYYDDSLLPINVNKTQEPTSFKHNAA